MNHRKRRLQKKVQTDAFKLQPCVVCGKVGSTTVDHCYPRSKGGANSFWNYLPLCAKCNRSKQDLLPSQWLETLSPEVQERLRGIVGSVEHLQWFYQSKTLYTVNPTATLQCSRCSLRPIQGFATHYECLNCRKPRLSELEFIPFAFLVPEKKMQNGA